MSLLNRSIQAPNSEVFRRCFIKRRLSSTGQYETDWLDISRYVKKWGRLSKKLDAAKFYVFTFGNSQILFDNESGAFNPATSESSLWYGYLNQQRTLVKIETGFSYREKQSSGRWANAETPGDSVWDAASWDVSDWGETGGSPIVFQGIISGDMMLSDGNELNVTVKPLVSVFQDFPAKNLTGWTSTGLTASQFITMVRDQTDGSSNYIFRPFFGNTTTYFDISTTSNVYGNLNTSTAKDVIDANVWQVIEKLSEAENFVPYITNQGAFKFVSRASNTTTAAFTFYGAGYFDTEYGQTIKKVSSYGFRASKYYGRVQVKFVDADTSTSYAVAESSYSVSPSSNPWVLGNKTLNIENFFVPTSTVAQTIADAVKAEVSALKNEITFQTTYIPHLDILDRVAIYYDPNPPSNNSLWDRYSWADDATQTTEDLVWDESLGDAINISGTEFKFLSIEVDLDGLQCNFIAREI